MSIPKTCPNCGAGRESFVADYYEAVRQGIVFDEDGSYDYEGLYDHYDDGSTSDECIRCTNCFGVVESFGEFRLVSLPGESPSPRDLATSITNALPWPALGQIEDDHNDNPCRSEDGGQSVNFTTEIDGRLFLITIEDITLDPEEE